jgi:hypothetical protein
MANVKITDLTELAAVDVASNDVLPIVDINNDSTKKVTIASLVTSVADANDHATFTILNANINQVSSNADAFLTQLNANLDVVQDNVSAISVTLGVRGDGDTNDDVTVGTEELVFLGDTGITTAVTGNTVSFDLDDTSVTAGLYGGVEGTTTNVAVITVDAQGRITAASNATVSVDLSTLEGNVNTVSDNVTALEANVDVTNDNVSANFNQLDANINVVQDNVSAVEQRRSDNVFFTYNTDSNIIIDTANVEPSQNNVFSLGAPDRVWKDLHVGPGSIFIGANTALKADSNGDVQIVQSTDNSPRTLVVDRLDIGSGANKVRLQNNGGKLRQINKGNPNVADDSASQNDLDNVQSNVAAVETRRTNNIAGAISTVLTDDLTVSRALVSDGSGKIAISDVTSTEIGHLDGVTSSIQTQFNALEARRAANLESATFTGEVNMNDDLIVTGNLIINGETTTVNSENKVIQDRFIMLANSVSGSPSADVGILFNRGTSGNAALFYDESEKFFTLSETRDPDTNVAISPTGSANLSVGQLTASSVEFDGADLSTAITDNVSTLNTSITAVETRRTNNIAGAISTVLTSDLTASRALVSDSSGKVAVSDVTSTELGHLDGVSSAIQTQLNAKGTTTEDAAIEARRVANIAGAVSTITTSDLTGSRALVSDSSGKVAVSAVTATEISRLDGVTSAIQTQLNAKLESVGTNDIDDNAVTVGKLAATLDLGALG